MAVSEDGVVFLKDVNCEKEYKDKFYVETLIKDAISEVGVPNVVQVITDNAPKLHDESLYELIKRGLQNMVISDEWSTYREDNVSKAYLVKEKNLDNIWWDKVYYILTFTEPIYDMLRIMDTDKPTLHLVYEMWDEMIEKVKKSIYRHEGDERSIFYEVVYDILIDRWTKSSTPLHCMAHSLNPRWLLDPKSWWLVHGASIPLLQNLALKLLGQPSSSSCCERNWSTRCGILEVMYLTHLKELEFLELLAYLLMNWIWRW
ncbi:uncharacterized protein LOC105793263 [Gossypium raimondii]|uniref:uncharacterized protein LOC105793263 n=1 Tax=Gossypium raimondii TaxID=29730 RepID=UPI00227B5344|nr:uncharacterized protein LOC105793263 [Gossypium raimondii]